MLFAEIFSGASQTWFINPVFLILTFPLYLFHALFLLSLALKSKKTSLAQLYLFGVIFALYESWITKVLWAGYMDQTGPTLSTFLGLAVAETPILVFFWHPIMSFIVPILAYQVLTGQVLKQHKQILTKSVKKTILLLITIIALSTFIANGNQFNPASALASIIGTLTIITLLYQGSKKSNIKTFYLQKKGTVITYIYLILLYITTFFLLLPERIPTTIPPYITIAILYIIPIYLIRKSKPQPQSLNKLTKDQYSKKDFALFAIIATISAGIASLVPVPSMITLAITYGILSIIGMIIFVVVAYKNLKQNK